MILRANYPYNYVICPIRRGGKWRAATATRPGHIPTACAVNSYLALPLKDGCAPESLSGEADPPRAYS